MGNYDSSQGVWRTIRGRRVFIRDGEDLSSAMKRSGKFDNLKREDVVKAKKEIELNKVYNKNYDDLDRYGKTEYEEAKKWAKEITKNQDEMKRLKEELDMYDNSVEYKGDTSKLEGKHIAGREARAREIDKINKTSISDSYEVYEEENGYSGKGKELLKFIKAEEEDSGVKISNKIKKELELNPNQKYLFDNNSETLNKYQSLTKRAREIDKINSGNPIESMTNDRIKEKENTLANDKAMLEGMKRNGINEVQGWTQKDFGNRIKNNEDYLNVAKSGNYSASELKDRDENIKQDLSRPYVEQPDGTYADPKSPFTKRTSSELRKQIKELEPYTEELQVGNRVIINTGGGKYGVRNVGDEDDPMTDYSAYVYGFNAKMIIQNAREQGIITDTPKTSKTTEAKVERFKERKGKTIDTMSKQQLAEKIVDDQIARGVVKSENKDMLIRKKMQDYSKSDLLDYFK